MYKLIFLVASILVVNLSIAHGDAHDEEEFLLSDLGNLGKVEFSISCGEEAQVSMNSAVALLHHMMYAQAEINFNKMMSQYPDCAMAYWGYAMTLFHPIWPDTITEESLKSGEFALNIALELKNKTQREELYIKAVSQYYKNWQSISEKERVRAWEKGQKLVYENHPEDIDAAVLFALSHLATANASDKSFSQQKEAGIILDKLFLNNPIHPGVVHYSIHAYDSNLLAHKAVAAARSYDKISPNVPHALHMPSHIFVRLGMWEDVIAWNIRSSKAALNYPVKNATSLHYAHAIDYLNYAYLQLEKYDKVHQEIETLNSHHQHQDNFPVAYAFAAIEARLELEQKNWVAAKDLPSRQPSYLSWDKYPHVESITYYAKGLGAARSGDLKQARETINILDQLYNKTLAISPHYWAILIDAQRLTVESWISFAKGDKVKALEQLNKAADMEDSLDKNPVTPGAVLPSRELLADMLVMNGDYDGALIAYKATLKINPNRLNSLKGVDLCKSKIVAMASNN